MKKGIKKLTVLATVASMLLSSVVSYADDSTDKKWDFLETLGIYSGENAEELGGETVTRGDYVTYFMRLLNKDYEAGENLFTDVDDGDEFYDAANNAKSLGYFTGLEFRPDDNINTEEALEMLERAMGYSVPLKHNSILSVASDMDLPLPANSEKMTFNEMTELFYAALHAPLMKYDISLGGTTTLEPEDDATVLSEYYDIEIIEGIMTANGVTSIYKADSGDKITIDGTNYGDPNEMGKEYLGYNVRAYIDFTNDEEFGELKYIEEKKNTVVELEAEEIDQMNTRVTKITYTQSGKDKSVSKKIDENAKVIYNGRFYASYTAADLMPENGNMKLIDNDEDGVFEVVHIWSYSTIYVDSFVNNTVYNKYSYSGALSSLKVDEREAQIDVLWDGEKNKITDIKAGQILSAAVSKDKEYIKIEISKASVKGTLGGINTDERELLIDDEYYDYIVPFGKEYTNLELGRGYIFYLNFRGEIAAAEKSSANDYEYAYVFKISYQDGEETADIKLFTQDGEWERYTVTDNVKIDGKRYTPEELVYGKKGVACPLYSDGATDRQVVQVKYDGDTIKEIKTAEETTQYDRFNKKTANLNYYGQNQSFSSLYYVNSQTVVFGIPSDTPEKTDAYMVAPSLTWDGAYTITAYGYDEYGDTDAFEIPITSSNIGKSISNCIVLDKHKILNSDDTVVETLRCSFGMFEDFEIEFNDTNQTNLKKGDLISLKVDYKGKIKTLTPIYSYVDEGEKLYSPSNLHSDSNLHGYVVKIDKENKRIIMNLGGSRGYQPLRIDDDEIVVKKYSVRKNKCDLISINDIEPGDYLVMYSGGSSISSIIKYDKE